jgi:hypothetical protein
MSESNREGRGLISSLDSTKITSLLIDYDVVDRYTSHAGGCKQVNIIRNITTRKTTLQKWWCTVTKAELGRCDRIES